MNLEDLRIYKIGLEIGDEVWNIVIRWDYFQKGTVGKQLVKAADSIAANISEGYGRYHYKDSKNFNYFSRGSIYETKSWLTKAHNRKLISTEAYTKLLSDIEALTNAKQLY